MRERERILSSLEGVYGEAFDEARERSDDDAAARLDFEFQRDQLHLEAMLDIRELLLDVRRDAGAETGPPAPGSTVSGLLDKAQALRRFTRPK
jgi:hypothetical protein